MIEILHPTMDDTDNQILLCKKFTNVLSEPNFMTPTVMFYAKILNGVIEVSKGRGITHHTIYGVTVVENGKVSHEKSGCCYTLSEVAETVVELGGRTRHELLK